MSDVATEAKKVKEMLKISTHTDEYEIIEIRMMKKDYDDFHLEMEQLSQATIGRIDEFLGIPIVVSPHIPSGYAFLIAKKKDSS